MKLHVILFIALAVVAWLMPLVYVPATPYVWGGLALYVGLVLLRALYNWLTLDRKRNILPALALLLLAAGCAQKPAVTKSPEYATHTYTADGWDHTEAGK